VVVIPDTRYTRTPDGFYIAYQVVGQGLIDFAWMPGFILGNVEVVWEHPLVEAFLGRFASIGRLIIHDRRGTGLSDRATSAPGLETRAIDLLAALIAAGSSRTVLIGGGEGGALAAFVAAGRPDLVSGLVWWQAQPRSRWAQDYPWGATQEEVNSWLGEVERGWGTESFASAFVAKEAPSLRGDQSVIRWLARMQRHWVTPGSAVELARIWYETDIREVLPSISVPTLILDREGLATEEQAFTASLIPAAERVVIPGNDAPPWAGDQESLISAVLRFLQIERSATDHNRVLATVLFTDMVDSTTHAASLGDHRWKALLADHDDRVREALSQYQGREVDSAGDGVFATFDGPARAVRCAQAMAQSVHNLGLEIRAGCHTGEVELVGEKVRGIATHIGARVCALAGPGEVLVSQTVKDLTAGSGLVFEDAGEHELKGVPDRWHLYRVME